MKTFIKAQAASLAATLVDFLVTVFCVELLTIQVVLSGAIGNVAGAFVNFLIGRKWVFKHRAHANENNDGVSNPDDKPAGFQALKYALVWGGYLVLSAAGMTLMGYFPSIHYVVAKMIVGLTLAVTYNYFLQKKFVFN